MDQEQDSDQQVGRSLSGQPDIELRDRAKKNLEARRDFRMHLSAYVIVNAALVIIWLLTGGPSSHFWPAYPMLGWGIGIAFHALSLRDGDPTPEQIDAEARRLAERRRRIGPQDSV